MKLTIKFKNVDSIKRASTVLCLERDEILSVSFMQESNSAFKIVLSYLLSDERLSPGDRYWNREHMTVDPVIDNLHAAVLNKGDFRKVLKTPEEFSEDELHYIVNNDLNKFKHYAKRELPPIETEEKN